MEAEPFLFEVKGQTHSWGQKQKGMLVKTVETGIMGIQLAEIGVAANGQPLYHLHSNAHLMGGCRMGSDPETSVVNSFGQSHDIKNLFIAGSASFVTAPAANPTLTVYSLALRTAEYILEEMKAGNL